MTKVRFWSLFGAVQAIGIVLPLFGNVHLNVAPILISGFLRLPGIVIVSMLGNSISIPVQISFVILINGIAWYFVGTLLLRNSN